MHIFLGFDFYGAGNIGDDLMLAGLLTLIPAEHQLTCVLPRDPASQVHRFPRIHWIQGGDREREDAIRQCDLWLGAGATPFSPVHRAWLLRHMDRDLQHCRRFDKPVALVGVDAEQSLLHSEHRDLGARILEQCRSVITRDQASVAVLQTLDYEAGEKVMPGIDLANFYLATRNWPKVSENGMSHVGVCYWEECMDPTHWACLRSILYQLRSEGVRHTFFANEVRRDFEASVYRRVFRFLDRVRFGKHSRFYCPNYATSSLEGLISHYRLYDTVLSSRYHALLIAAWSGSRPLAIGHRTKVVSLVRDLEIPWIPYPGSLNRLLDIYQQAKNCQQRIYRHYLDWMPRQGNAVEKALGKSLS